MWRIAGMRAWNENLGRPPLEYTSKIIGSESRIIHLGKIWSLESKLHELDRSAIVTFAGKSSGRHPNHKRPKHWNQVALFAAWLSACPESNCARTQNVEEPFSPLVVQLAKKTLMVSPAMGRRFPPASVKVQLRHPCGPWMGVKHSPARGRCWPTCQKHARIIRNHQT